MRPTVQLFISPVDRNRTMVDVYRGRTREQWNAQQIVTSSCACDGCYWAATEGERPLFDMASGPDYLYQRAFKAYMKKWAEMCPLLQQKMVKPHHKGNGAPKGMFAGTLTVSPHDPYNEEDMVQAIRKVLKGQKTCPVKRFSWYLEYTEANLPHIHFIYETPTGGRIPAKVFKRAWPIWDEHAKMGAGHRGGYHRVVSDAEGYLKYIEKDKGRHETSWPQ